MSYDGTTYVRHIAYNAKGQRLFIAFGNDMMTRYTYDNDTFRLLRQRSEKYTKTQQGSTITYAYQNATKKQDDGYGYDLIGNILEINKRTTGCGVGGTDSLDRTFEYDPLYRLKSATGRENVPTGGYPFPGWQDTTRSTDPNTTEAYTRKYKYDKLGNIQELRQIGNNSFTRTFSYTDNKLDSIDIGTDSYTFTYDAAGNQLTENIDRQYQWDAANQLLTFRNQVGTNEPTVLAQYLYDGEGNRVKKIVRKQGGNYEIRVYIDGVFEYLTDETEEQNTVHIMDDKSRIATIRIGAAMGDSTPATKYVLENNINSSMVMLDTNGSVVNEQEYYPFGETSFGSYGKKRYQYTGKERDEESGLYYYGARYYSPWTCKFTSLDPLAADYPHLTPYNYAGNKPVTHKDIDGLQGTGDEKQGGSSQQSNNKTQDSNKILIPTNNVAENDMLKSDIREPVYELTPLEIPEELTVEGAAQIASNVYGGPDAAMLINGWEKADQEMAELRKKGVVFKDPKKTGFQSTLYKRTNTEGETEYVYAFAGTNDIEDVKHDASQAAGLGSEQYKTAVKNAEIIDRELNENKLSFVGHSLGGGLASAAALATGRDAITFNAAGLHPNTKQDIYPKQNADIDAYIVKGEMVDYTQTKIGLKAEGTPHYIDASYMIVIPGTKFDDGIRFYQRIRNHLIGIVIQKIKDQKIK